MDRRELINSPVEALLTAMEGHQARMWTALPGLVESFNPSAMTMTVQPAIKGLIEDEYAEVHLVNLPLLVDVPIVFPGGGGFTLTYPVRSGDECLVVFSSRCIDGWWQNGGIGGIPEFRMHDLSDGFGIVGPRSQPRRLSPPVDTSSVQLRTDDGEAHVTLMPDYGILAKNPAAQVTLTPAGEIEAKADARITLSAPAIVLEAASISMGGLDGGSSTATFKGDISQEGSHTTTGDQIAGGISLMSHTHGNTQPGSGSTGRPQ